MKDWQKLAAAIHDALNTVVTNSDAEELGSLQERSVDLESFFGEEPDDMLLDMLDALEKLTELRDEFGALMHGVLTHEPLYAQGEN